MTAWMWLLVVLPAAALGVFTFYGQHKTEEPESLAAKLRRDRATREILRGGRARARAHWRLKQRGTDR